MRALIIGGGYVGLATALQFKHLDIFLYDKYTINQSLYSSRFDFTFKQIDHLNIDVVFGKGLKHEACNTRVRAHTDAD